MELLIGAMIGIALTAMLTVSTMRRTSRAVNMISDNLDGAHKRLLNSEQERIRAQRRANSLEHQLNRGE